MAAGLSCPLAAKPTQGLKALIRFFTVPLEVQLLKREYFNRWYGLTSYFFAYSLARLPALVFCTSLYVVIAYFMTDQPLEWYRFSVFLITMLTVGCISESLGMVLGSIFNVVVRIYSVRVIYRIRFSIKTRLG